LFNTSGAIGGSNNLFWDISNGRLGIGTTTTTYRLNVNGTTFTTGLAVGADTLVGSYINSAIGASRFQHSAAPLSLVNTAGTYCLEIIGLSNTYSGRFGYTSDNLLISVNNAERMRIDSSGNVAIGTSSPSATAILDVQSTTKGVRMPNMTTTQKNAISSPAAGLMVFDTTLAKLCVYSGSAWQTITSV
jgi:hypothetical protein